MEQRGQRDARYSEHEEDSGGGSPRPAVTRRIILNSFNGALLLLALLLTVTFFGSVQGQPPPPAAGFLDFDNLPMTRFTCDGKVIGGYYADVETDCQMFHVCTVGQKDEIQDIKFLCLNGTVFDQETRVCERVDEVDCSKAEQFYDLNLDLYVQHVTTPKPQDSEQDEEDEDYPRPGAKSIQNNKVTAKPITTTTTTTTTTVSPRTRPPPPPPSPPSTTKSTTSNSKGFSSFNYYLRTPHSHVASGYNSQLRQSYIINNNHPTGASTTTGRKVPSGPKTIVYGGNSASSPAPTSRPSPSPPQRQYGVAAATTTSPKRTPPPKTQTPVRVVEPELEEQYSDDYYDDADPDYAVSSSTTGSNQAQSPNSKSYEQQNTKNYQQQVHYPSNSKPTILEYRDGRSATSPRISSSKSTSNENKPEVSVAVSSSSAVQQNKPIIQAQAPLPLLNNSTEEPYYYDDEDYPDEPLPVVDTNRNQNINTNTKSTISTSTNKNRDIGITPGDKLANVGVPGDSSTTSENIEYYDDNENINTHDHHFSHVDVPRIPFAKPNVPRVLVTNGKPFLPRLRRQSFHHHLLSSSKSGNLGESPVWKTFLLNPPNANLSNHSNSFSNSDYDNYFNSKNKISASSRLTNRFRNSEETHVNVPAGYYGQKRR